MAQRLPISEIVNLLKSEFKTEFINSVNMNKYDISMPNQGSRLYVSQSKPSKSSKGNWKYEFFHTLDFSVLEEVLDGIGILILVNYVDRIYVVLQSSDIAWAIRYSSRAKGYDEEVTDFVIEKNTEDEYQIRPYDRFNPRRRSVNINKF